MISARNGYIISPSSVAQAVRWACVTEVRALKPGNVSVYASGHGMVARDFLRSAEAIVPHLAKHELRIGARILSAVKATQDAVSCNTNLGIVLLCAPLVYAAERVFGGISLRRALQLSLASLDVEDAEHTYQAIRLASPGGLGESERFDVNEKPHVSLIDAMNEAKTRDRIASQYASGYHDIFEIGVPQIRQARVRWQSEEWAAVACYLAFLSRLPDTHIARKSGIEMAKRVSREAISLETALGRSANPENLLASLLEWDRQLKERQLNPGTTADLTVASLLAVRLEDILDQQVTDSEDFNLVLQ
jgi:triphosphoribosyl-dephospho-CoA synthase